MSPHVSLISVCVPGTPWARTLVLPHSPISTDKMKQSWTRKNLPNCSPTFALLGKVPPTEKVVHRAARADGKTTVLLREVSKRWLWYWRGEHDYKPRNWSILTTLKFRRLWQQTFTINRSRETKQLTEMLPGILNQFGADSLTSLRRLAEAAQTIWMEKHRSLLKRWRWSSRSGGEFWWSI